MLLGVGFTPALQRWPRAATRPVAYCHQWQPRVLQCLSQPRTQRLRDMGLCGSSAAGNRQAAHGFTSGRVPPDTRAEWRQGGSKSTAHKSSSYDERYHVPVRKAPAPAARPSAAPSTAAMRAISLTELNEHVSRASSWLAVNRRVYDVTDWIHRHPGGENVLLPLLGGDCTEAAQSAHSYINIEYALRSRCIGRLC